MTNEMFCDQPESRPRLDENEPCEWPRNGLVNDTDHHRAGQPCHLCLLVVQQRSTCERHSAHCGGEDASWIQTAWHYSLSAITTASSGAEDPWQSLATQRRTKVSNAFFVRPGALRLRWAGLDGRTRQQRGAEVVRAKDTQ